jgi:hypothetical protein
MERHCTETTASDTQSVTIEAPRDSVYAFVADPENLPRWAVGFCQAIRPAPDSDGWMVTTASGDIPLRYETDDDGGTIDFYFRPLPTVEVAAFSRVVPNGDSCEYIFTQFQTVGMPDDVFAGQIRALREELNVLRGLMHARAACPA